MTGAEDEAGSDTHGFARIIKKRHPTANVYNYGVSGSVISQNGQSLYSDNGSTRTLIPQTIATYLGNVKGYSGGDPDYIVLNGGGNDFLGVTTYGSDYYDTVFGDVSDSIVTYDYTTVYHAFESILLALFAAFPQAKIIATYMYTMYDLMSVASLTLQLTIQNNLAHICNKYGVTFFDLSATTWGASRYFLPYTSDGSLFKDSIHPTEEGYDFIATEFDTCLVTGVSNHFYNG